MDQSARLSEIRFGLEGWDEAETRRFADLAGLVCADRDADRGADAGRRGDGVRDAEGG